MQSSMKRVNYDVKEPTSQDSGHEKAVDLSYNIILLICATSNHFPRLDL